MYCDSNGRGLTIFLIHFLGGISILIISYLSDRFGRKIFMIIIVVAGIIGSILLLIPSSLTVSALGVALGNCLVDFLFLLGFTYYSEVSTKNSRILANILMFLSIAFGSFICLIIATFTEKFQVIDLLVLLLLIPLLILSIAMRESIYFLYNNKAKKEFFNTLMLMAEINEVNLKQIVREIHPKIIDGDNYSNKFFEKNKFQTNPNYSYRDFSKDFSEFSMRGTEYHKRDNLFEDYSKDKHKGPADQSSESKNYSKEEKKFHDSRHHNFNYSLDKHFKDGHSNAENQEIGNFIRFI